MEVYNCVPQLTTPQSVQAVAHSLVGQLHIKSHPIKLKNYYADWL